jgi:hypothetical protein
VKLLRSHWVVAIVVAVVIAGGVIGGLLGTRSTSSPTTNTATSGTPATAASLPRVYSKGCPAEYPATIKATEIPIACADYGIYISGILWSSWTSTSAQGSGTLHVNNCTPNCASGTFSTYPTPVSLSDPVQTVTQGLVFATLTYTTPNGSSGSLPMGPPNNCTQGPANLKYC